MDWIIFAVISVFCFALANLFRRIVMRDDKTDAIASGIVFQLLSGILIGIFAFSRGFVIPPFSEYAVNFFLIGVLWALATIFQFKAYHYLEASEAIIISTLETVVVIIAAQFFLKDTISVQMLIGTALVIIGSIVITKTKKKMTFNRGIAYALLFCLFAGFGTVNDVFMVKRVEAMSYLAFSFLLPGFFLMLIRPKSIKKIAEVLQPKNFIKIFSLTLFYAAGAIIFVFAILKGGQVSQISPILNSSVILTVILATIFLSERDHLLRKFICSILVTIGVLLLR